jgi:hypothetical protein
MAALLDWEVVCNDGESFERVGVRRAKVPGGWLYQSYTFENGSPALAMAFVPDWEPPSR